MSDWLKRLSKVLLVTDKFTVQIKQGYKEAKELWKNDYCRILKRAIAISTSYFFVGFPWVNPT
ncbi:Similarity (fragment) [Microcystis aeruginosa PCC 9808]|uniref:Similarity n=1 Tax=Microcystis aeruginosa PCC 9808 TaxID=1160284 RepID=I4HU92_MICAE